MSVRRPAVGGADGCPPGWILVVRSADGAVEGQLCRSAAELFERAGELAALAIDIPIGIPEAGARPADREARALLGPRRNSVFPAPVRAALEATDYRDASERSFRAQGKRLSKQAYHLIPKIREIDAALRADARMAARVHEVHPEVSFTLLNDGVPMPAAKKSAEGRAARLALVEREFPGAFGAIRGRYPKKEMQDDDILDALAALWSAERIAAGRALTIPAGPRRFDPLGLPMTIQA